MKISKYLNLKKETVYILIFILFVLLFHGICNWQFLKQSQFYFCGGSGHRFITSIKLFNSIKSGDFLNTYKLCDHSHPPLVATIAAFSYFLFGLSQDTAIMTNLLYFAILLFSTYRIATELYNPSVGILASFLLSVFPHIFGHSRVFLLDFPLTALVALTIYFIIVHKFSSLKHSVLTGICLGFGLLIKWSYFIFIIPPFIYLFLKNKFNIKNVFISFFIGLILASSWYWPNRYSFIEDLFTAVSVTTPDVAMYNSTYFEFFYEKLLLLPFFILFLISLIYSVLKKKFILPLTIAIPVFLLSFTTARQPRLILPVLVAVAIVMAGFINEFKYRKSLSLTVVLFSLLQFFFICYMPNKIPYLKKFVDKSFDYSAVYGFYTPITTGYWKTDEVFKQITSAMDNKLDQNRVLIISPHHLLIYPLRVKTAIEKVPLDIISPADRDNQPLPKIEFDPIVQRFSYVLYKTGDQGVEWHKDYINGLYASFIKLKDKFSFLGKYTLPDDSTLYIYKKIK